MCAGAISFARIRRLYTTPDGALWICAHDGSITSYRDGKFSLEWNGEGQADSAVTLISTWSNGPTFMLRTGEFIRWQSGAAGTNRWETLRSPGASAAQNAVEDGAGVIWCCGRDQKIYRLRGSVFEAVPGNGELAGANISTLTADVHEPVVPRKAIARPVPAFPG